MQDIPNIDWMTRHMSEAYLSARKSKDPRTQVGAAVVGADNVDRSKGYNGPCRGMDDADPDTFRKPGPGIPPPFIEHAERNAIYNAARFGIALDGCTMYVTLHPCLECARAIRQAGIRKVVLHGGSPQELNDTQKLGAEIFRRCNIEVETWTGDVLIDAVRFDGEVYFVNKAQA